MKVNVDGMSISDILDLSQADISRMSRSDLAKVTSRLASAANKRIKRAVGTEYEKTVKDRAGGSNFSVKGKNQGQLQGEFARARQFLTSKTSSIKGAKKVAESAMKRIGAPDAETASKLWGVYNRVKEMYPDLVARLGSDRIQQMIRQEHIQDPEELILSLQERIENEYEALEEEYQEEESSFGIFSDFFDVGENPFF